jgi:putative DNA primase/helicase
MTDSNSTNHGPRRLGVQPTELDYERLAKSFISREIVDLAGIGRVSDIEGADAVGRKRNAHTDNSGLVFPHFLPHDFTHPREYCLRLDHPEMELNSKGELKEKNKYVWPPGVPNFVYFPPGVTVEMLQDQKLPLVITEGVKKVLALLRVALLLMASAKKWPFIPIGLSGVWNFRGTVGKMDGANGGNVKVKGVIPDMDLISWRKRNATILFDSNVRTNPSVQIARWMLGGELKNRGAKVLYAELPEDSGVNGIDDYAGEIEHAHGTDLAVQAVLQILDNAQKPAKTVNPTPSNFRLDKDGPNPGVYFIDATGEPFFVCAPLEVTAEISSSQGGNYGRHLEWSDPEERPFRFAMPIEMVHGKDASELVKHLSSRGLLIGTSPKHYNLLRAYINLSEPGETMLCTDRIGWHNDSYVLPGECIGKGPRVVVRGASEATHKFNTNGTLDEWRENVARYCVGNSRLGFAVATAFAAPLLPFLDMRVGGGFHFTGPSSLGKTTCLIVGGSVWGGSPDPLGYCVSWRATDNALEGVCLAHNNSLLCLDEIGQCDPRKIGEIAYMLANGAGKNRMDRDAVLKQGSAWQLLYLSTGEKRVSQMVAEAGQTVKGGQLVRLCDIDADTGVHGMFEDLHEFPNGQSMADHLRVTSNKFYGTAIREFLKEFLEAGRENVLMTWPAARAEIEARLLAGRRNVPSEVSRVAELFAAVAFGGEAATRLGVTGWPEGEATAAAERVFASWLSSRSGRGPADEENAISQVRLFLEKHGEGRFQSYTEDPQEPEKVPNRAGFKKVVASGRIHYAILPEVFKEEVCRGYNPTLVAAALKSRGFLIHDKDKNKNQKTERIPALRSVTTKVYMVSSKIFDAESIEDPEVENDQENARHQTAG